MLWNRILAASLLSAAGAEAGSRVLLGPMAGSQGLERRLSEKATMAIERRQTTPTQPQSPNVTLMQGAMGVDMAKWDTETSVACNLALSQLNVASNPSGTAICYNLPALDNVTGIFEADLRLYQLSEPSGEFAGIPPENIQVGLIYHGSAVSAVDPKMLGGRSVDEAEGLLVPRQAAPNRTAPELRLLQAYIFVGQIDTNELAVASNDMALLEALVMPTVTLTGMNQMGQTVTTNVSSNEAAFVSGFFSQEIIMSPAALAQKAVDDVMLGLQNSTVAFVLPGVQLLIFPVGLVITSLWLVIGASIIGFGTWERNNYRRQYRQRTAMQGK